LILLKFHNHVFYINFDFILCSYDNFNLPKSTVISARRARSVIIWTH